MGGEQDLVKISRDLQQGEDEGAPPGFFGLLWGMEGEGGVGGEVADVIASDIFLNKLWSPDG